MQDEIKKLQDKLKAVCQSQNDSATLICELSRSLTVMSIVQYLSDHDYVATALMVQDEFQKA